MMIDRIRVVLHSPDRFNRLRDFFYTKFLFSLPQGLRRRLFVGKDYYCPVCQSRLKRFLVLHRAYNIWCPICLSLPRHRLIWLLSEQEGWLNHPPENQMRLLHIAPESCLEEKFRQTPGINYVSADLYNRHAMTRVDISAMQFDSESFDLILCSHVLEHVPDDLKAISELRRTLKPTGRAVILVPIHGEKTEEDPSITDPLALERRFGQLDHVRSYGMDFIHRLEHSGFSVRTLTTTSLQMDEQGINRMGLRKPDIVFICQK